MSQTDLHSHLALWAIKLNVFKFKIEHRSGSSDALPRVNESELAALKANHGLFVDVDHPSLGLSFKSNWLRV